MLSRLVEALKVTGSSCGGRGQTICSSPFSRAENYLVKSNLL